MPYAAVTYVNLAGRDADQAVKLLQEVLVPRLRGLNGYRSARFMRSLDGQTGVGAVLFTTEADAKAGLDAMIAGRPSEAPPIDRSELYEVVLED